MRGLALADVRFNADGLVPVVAATGTGRVLMLAWADREALERTLATGQMHYHSRSRGALWRKGETSGHGQRVRSLHLDCDGDTVLALVDQEGPACHTGAATCFDKPGAESKPDDWGVLSELLSVVRSRRGASGSYTAKLLADENLRAKKVAEESGEFIRAAAKGDRAHEAEEAADLLYHLLVACEGDGVPFEEVLAVLRKRREARP